jgi:hypothetical protein
MRDLALTYLSCYMRAFLFGSSYLCRCFIFIFFFLALNETRPALFAETKLHKLTWHRGALVPIVFAMLRYVAVPCPLDLYM